MEVVLVGLEVVVVAARLLSLVWLHLVYS